jgi:uncharacterized protein (DUF433 family)
MLLTSDNLRITIASGKRSDEPCIRGIRITAPDMVESLAAGRFVDEILSDCHELTAEDTHTCLAFAAECECRLLTSPESVVRVGTGIGELVFWIGPSP